MKKTHTTPYHMMGNGMVDRIKKMLLNMLWTLQDNQKADLKSHMSTLYHAYNAASNDSTGFSILVSAPSSCGGRRLPQSQEQVKSRQDYVDKLKQRMISAYNTASSEARMNADRQKGYYDCKVRYVKLEVGYHLLAKNVCLRGKQNCQIYGSTAPNMC